MSSIQLTRRAIRDLKHLSEQTGLLRIPDLLADLQQDRRRYDTRRLEGVNNGLKRVKYDRLRLIFQDESAGAVVKAVRLRDDRTYTSDYNALAPWPSYEWHGEQGGEWLRFVTGSYRYSPVITQAQEESITVNNWQSAGLKVSLVQNPPGTGKTLAALLRACEYYQQGWDIAFLVPAPLIQDVERFKAYQTLDRNQPNQFFLGTFRDWLAKFFQAQNFASAEEELIAFRQAAKNIYQHEQRQDLSHRDVLLYQAFILDRAVGNQDRSAIYQDNARRIEWLRQQVKQADWNAALGEKLSRWKVAQLIQTNQLPRVEPQRSNVRGTIIVIDEAQDYLLSELKAMIHLGRTWGSLNYPVHLWLFGDLNQRIQPVNFTWGHLEIDKVCTPSWQNFRNSRRILEFANPFLDRVPRSAKVKQETPAPGNPELASEEGEPVRLVVYNSKAEANAFLEQLQQTLPSVNSEHTAPDRSLLQSLSRQVKVLVSDADRQSPTPEVEFLTVEQVKGREFESSIAFCLFDSAPPINREQVYRWYTLLTRTRSRLLIIATQQEIEQIGESYFAHCQRIVPENAQAVHHAIQWVTSVIHDADAAERVGDIKQQILDGCITQPLYLYWDMYDALRAAECSDEHLTDFEQELIKLLSTKPIADRERELMAATTTTLSTVSLQCLLLRSMHRSWDAVQLARQLIGINNSEYQRLIQAIANDLERKGLPYEAARVRHPIESSSQTELLTSIYPYPELLSRSGNLIPLLSQAVRDRLSGLLDEDA
ncbi:hypothetical protein [Egbenema bharatensis]|uniref:hypothetical protein n=1 Tax=Egbenema bharatensis TaxID=3463334 RepID=UPI003A8BB881